MWGKGQISNYVNAEKVSFSAFTISNFRKVFNKDIKAYIKDVSGIILTISVFSAKIRIRYFRFSPFLLGKDVHRECL